MANTTERHKKKKSQKRKDRQERRRQKKLQKIVERSDNAQECPNGESPSDENQEKTQKKSLPGLLAKNSRNVVRWLNDYLVMFMKCDDEGSKYIREMPYEQHKQLIQDYVDIRILISEISEFQ